MKKFLLITLSLFLTFIMQAQVVQAIPSQTALQPNTEQTKNGNSPLDNGLGDQSSINTSKVTVPSDKNMKGQHTKQSSSTSPAPPQVKNSVKTEITSLTFEENKGQFSPSIDFIARSKGYNVLLSAAGPAVEFYKTRVQSVEHKVAGESLGGTNQTVVESVDSFNIQWLNANKNVQVAPLSKQVALTHYLIGKDKSNWHTGVENFGRIAYQNTYDGIDVHYHGNEGRLEYEFVVQPGANAEQIAMNFEGVSDLSLNEQGQLVLALEKSDIVQEAPFAYQKIDGGNGYESIAVNYRIDGRRVFFDLAHYDTSKPLIIDPVVQYSSYFGGVGRESALGGGVDADGNIYVIGTTTSTGLATAGVFSGVNSAQRTTAVSFPACGDCSDSDPNVSVQVERTTINNNSDNLFVSKFSPDGGTLLYTTYLIPDIAHSNIQIGVNSMGVSPSGEVAFGLNSVVEGLPLVNPTQNFDSNQSNVYIAKLNTTGTGMVFSTYLNLGKNSFNSRGLAVGADGSVVAVGSVGLGNTFPEVNSISGQSCQLDDSEYSDAYAAYFDPEGKLVFSSCFGGEIRTGGSVLESARGVDIGPNGHLYVVGYTAFDDFPLANPIQSTHGYTGSRDMFITQIDPAAGSIVFSTFYGPSSNVFAPSVDGGFQNLYPIDIKADAEGNIYTTGIANELAFPVINAAQPKLATPKSSNIVTTANPASDMYLTKMHPIDGVVFSTFVGGSKGEHGFPFIEIDEEGNTYLLAITDSDDYPLASALQTEKLGEMSIVLSKFSPLGRLSFSTYLGGTENDLFLIPGGVAINGDGDIVVLGWTGAADFPTVNPLQSELSGILDASITIISQAADVDTDGDGVIDTSDAFALNADEWLDTDLDGVGNNSDLDDDDDGVPDTEDAFPLDATETLDADGDGIGDNLDLFDADPSEAFDLDGDGIGDVGDTDTDGDGVNNTDEPSFLLDPSESLDTDGDGIGNNTDNDDDGDGVLDLSDIEPLNGEVPIITFETFSVTDTNRFKSPLPENFAGLVGSESAWTEEINNAYGGVRSLGTLPMLDNESAGIELTKTFNNGTLSFYYDIDSEENFDFLRFQLDGVELLAVSGQQSWTEFRTPITQGEHVLTWVYSKNDSVSTGTDSARIDNIQVFGSNSDSDLDGIADEYELANGLDPFNPLDAALDADSDGLSNFEEFRLGTNLNKADTDGDGIADNIDNNPLVFDQVAADLYSGQLHVLPDTNGDGISEIGLLHVDVGESKVRLEILNGKDRNSLDEVVWVDNFSDASLTLHVIPDMNTNGVDEVGLFGIQDIGNNQGKPQVFVRDLKTGNKLSVYNWVANWTQVSAMVLDDMTGDGLAEIAIQGRFKEGNRPQLVVKAGGTNTIVDTYSYPDLFLSPQYYQHSDMSGDGFEDIATFGRIARNNKIQVKIASGLDSKDRLKAYNFPDKWRDISWNRLDDMNGDGIDDWGLFGTNKQDGRPQLIVKNGTNPRGAISIYAWPAQIQAAQFYRIPDMNNDGVDEVAAAGRRSNNGRYQFQVQDGTDRNMVLANHNLNLNLESVSNHVLPDLSGDQKAEIGFLGMNPDGEWELVIRHGNTANGEYASYNLGSDWQNVPTISTLGDTDNDGSLDLLIYGQNASGEQLLLVNLPSGVTVVAGKGLVWDSENWDQADWQ